MLDKMDLLERLQSLEHTIAISSESLKDLKDRVKIIKKEIANTEGAILELNRLIDHME